MAFLISLGVNITPQALNIVSPYHYAYVENHYGTFIYHIVIFNHIQNQLY